MSGPHCPFCPEPVDPNSRYVARRVTGWERKAVGTNRRSGSDIMFREALDEWAHVRCIALAKQGLLRQESLLADDTRNREEVKHANEDQRSTPTR